MNRARIDLVDPSRPTAAAAGVPASAARSLPTTVYVPTGSGPAPLIILAHGRGGAPEKFSGLAAAWSGHGYVVAVPRFPLTNDQVPEPVVGDFPEQGRDVSFVIDEVLARAATSSGELSGRVDPERIGVFGLSLGSLTVWSTMFDEPLDTRVSAVIQSDGTVFLPLERFDEIGIPVFVAHSDRDPIFPYDQLLDQYDALPEPKFLLTLHGADHAAVAEDTVTPADEVFRDATTVFWDRTLGGAPGAAFPAAIDGVTSFVEGSRPDAAESPDAR